MSVPGSEEAAGAATAGLVNEDHLNAELDAESVPFSIATAPSRALVSSDASDASDAPDDDQPQRCGPYAPAFVGKYRGSIRLAFLSHFCFLAASLLYVRLSFLDLAWVRFTRSVGVPGEVSGADDDETWYDWTSAHADGSAVDDMAEKYDAQSKALYVSAAALFAFVGVLDWARYCDILNIVMVLAGAAGVISGLYDNSHKESVWNAVSVHLYFLEACNLLRREHDYEGHSCFRLGDVCFLLGSILDCIVSYFDLAGFEGLLWVVYTDMTACLLWLTCSLIDLSAEIYFLRKHATAGVRSCVSCY